MMPAIRPTFLAAMFILAAAIHAQTIATLRGGHPRLLLTDDALFALESNSHSEPLKRYIADAIARADAFLAAKPLEYKLEGPRLLGVSRDALQRAYALGLAFRLTRDDKYFTAARDNLLAISAFPDWHPSHFLDTAEMTHAAAIGYDWLHDRLSEADRATVRNAIVTHGLRPGLAVYTGAPHAANPSRFWVKASHNWNMVCNGGMIIGALAVTTDETSLSLRIIEAARASLPIAMATYGPDGAWPEGPGYWDYATSYVVYTIAALQSALGSDFGLLQTPGLSKTGRFPIAGTGPSGYTFNFADAGESKTSSLPTLFWLGKQFSDPFLIDSQHALLAKAKASPLDVIWYAPPSGNAIEYPPLDLHFSGSVDVVFLRSSWTDPDALFVGIKGGYNKVNHAHLDLGSFVLDALGERWAIDLGGDNYNLPGYFGRQRYDYYRLNSLSHNVPLIGGRSQNVEGVARLAGFSGGSSPAVVFDLASAYAPLAGSVRRTASLVGARRAAIIHDQFELTAPTTIDWGMTTRADITLIGEGGQAELSQNGKRIRVRILEPEGARFEIHSALQAPPQRENKGVRRLEIRSEADPGPHAVAVAFAVTDERGLVVPLD